MSILQTSVAAALRTEDVEGLLELGAPQDEYDSEAEDIAAAISKLRHDEMTEANIVSLISLVWAKSFNRSAEEIRQRLPAFQRIARQLL